MINIGIIGAGAWGEKHADAISSVAGAKLTAANRSTSDKLKLFCNKYDCKGYTDFRYLLEDPEIDAITIATPHHLHTEIAIAAANAGKHILLEKPFAPSLEECDKIILAAKNNKVVLMVGHTNHFVPSYQKVKQILDSGDLGRPVLIIDRTFKPWMNPNRRDWHLDRHTGGGMWMTIAVHNIDRMVWLMGSHVKSISANIDTYFHDQQADDLGTALIRFTNGTSGTTTVVGYRKGTTSFDTEIICTEGMIKVDKMSGVTIARDEQWEQLHKNRDITPENWMEDALIGEWEAFITAIKTGSQPEVTGEFARHIMEVVFAAEKSSKECKEVEILRS